MDNNKTRNLIRSSFLLAIAIVFQLIGKSFPVISQYITGPVVNAILLMTVFTCGLAWGIGVAALTPILAWLIGQLPPPMGPFVPFIMTGNMIFVFVFGLFRKKHAVMYAGIIGAALLKYLFLSLSASKLVTLFSIGIPGKILSKLVIMMGIPQLVTALEGGIIAVVLIKVLSSRKSHNIVTG